MKKAIFPGSFDPPTLGHKDIIVRASSLVDELIVAIGINAQKEKSTFSFEERLFLLKEITKTLPNVTISSFSSLLVDFAKEQHVSCIIRSMRNILDFEQETLQGQMNKMLSDVETVYLVVDEKYRMISSTLVKDIAQHGRRISDFVPEEIEDYIFDRLQK